MNRFWLKRTPWSRENLAERRVAEQEFEMLKSCAIVIALPFLWLLCIVIFVLWFFSCNLADIQAGIGYNKMMHHA